MYKRTVKYIKGKWAYLLSVFFLWCIPIVLLSEIVVLAKIHMGIKVTWIGYIVVCVVLVALKRKITGYIDKQNKTVQIVLSCFFKAVLYGVILIAILEIKAFYVKLLRWWIYSGISWIAGVVFSVIDKIKEKENGEEV